MSQSKTSGICIYCNVFFTQLAAHMLSSEKCMLASQDSLHNKRMRSVGDLDTISKLFSSQVNPNGVSKKICSNVECNNALINKIPPSFKYSLRCTSHTDEDINDFENDICINFSSNSSTTSDLAKDDHDYTFSDSKLSSTNSIVSTSMGTVQVLPVEGHLFNHAFTPEEHFMINLCNVCNECQHNPWSSWQGSCSDMWCTKQWS